MYKIPGASCRLHAHSWYVCGIRKRNFNVNVFVLIVIFLRTLLKAILAGTALLPWALLIQCSVCKETSTVIRDGLDCSLTPHQWHFCNSTRVGINDRADAPCTHHRSITSVCLGQHCWQSDWHVCRLAAPSFLIPESREVVLKYTKI